VKHQGVNPKEESGQLLTDLTNFGNVVSSLKYGNSDPNVGSGHQDTPQVTGIGAGALSNLDNGGKLELKDLLTNNHTIVPKH
jgi:hypothetical protein